MSDVINRKCCDACGAIAHSDDLGDGKECLCCGWIQSDFLLFHPDEKVTDELSQKNNISAACGTFLNYERFRRFACKDKRIFRAWREWYDLGGDSPYDTWRKAHPELGQRFDMCEFQEIPEIAEKIEENLNRRRV